MWITDLKSGLWTSISDSRHLVQILDLNYRLWTTNLDTRLQVQTFCTYYKFRLQTQSPNYKFRLPSPNSKSTFQVQTSNFKPRLQVWTLMRLQVGTAKHRDFCTYMLHSLYKHVYIKGTHAMLVIYEFCSVRTYMIIGSNNC